MRIAGLVLALLVTLSVAAAALTYLPAYIGQQRIYVQDWRSAPDRTAYHSYGYPGDTNPEPVRSATGEPDPYHQRYYSESEGWTYYTLPSDSSVRQGGDW